MRYSEEIESYLDQICRAPDVRQATRDHLFKLAKRLREESQKTKHPLSDEEAIDSALEQFGRPTSNQIMLEQLVELTEKFTSFVEWVGRPLLQTETRPFRWLISEWDAPHIKAATLVKSEERLEHYHDLMAQLREIFPPAVPAKKLRLAREKPEVVAQAHNGNFATKSGFFSGVSRRRLSQSEASERVSLMGQLANNIAVLARELSLVRHRDRPDAARMIRLGKRMTKMARVFADRCATDPSIPASRSTEEIMDDMKELSRLMEEEVA